MEERMWALVEYTIVVFGFGMMAGVWYAHKFHMRQR